MERSFVCSWVLGCSLLVGCGGKSTDLGFGPRPDGGLDGGADAEAPVDPKDDPHAVCDEATEDPVCSCEPGFERRRPDGPCLDVDECAEGTDDCDANATCENDEGAFSCSCNMGYAGDGKACADVDECAEATAGCDVNATCENSEGGFTCTCVAGYAGDGATCADEDECALDTHGCDPVALCENAPGSFTCACPSGYVDENDDGTVCTDIDECADGADDCDSDATCENTQGGFTCTCPGDQIGDGTDCQCDVEGTFAVRIETDVEWDPVRLFNVTVIEGGSDTLLAWVIRAQTRDGSTVTVSTKLCGGTSPDLCSNLLGEAYAQSIPLSLFDAAGIPLVPSTMDLVDASPGMPFVGGEEAQFVGLELDDPSGPWPAAWDSAGQTFPDHDADSHDAVSSLIETGATSSSCGLPYSYIPHPNNINTRIKSAFVGNRVLSNLDGTIIDCDTMRGNVAGPDGGLPRGEGHVVGCLVDTGSGTERLCTEAEFDTLDQEAQNVNQRSTAARFTAVRVADDVTCPDVRAMTFPTAAP